MKKTLLLVFCKGKVDNVDVGILVANASIILDVLINNIRQETV